MRSLCLRAVYYFIFLLAGVISAAPLYAQSGANSTTLSGVVVDSQGGVTPAPASPPKTTRRR
jgi:hypothetical protein